MHYRTVLNFNCTTELDLERLCILLLTVKSIDLIRLDFNA